jgi:WD40 repeat protein
MNLWRVRIDEKSGKVWGRPEAITTPSTYSGPISISGDGRRIAYVQQFTTSNLQRVNFDPVKERIISQPYWITRGSRHAGSPDLSPDDEWLAFHDGGKQEDIFIIKTDGTGLRQLTNDFYKDRYPRWSPDGRRIAFQSNRSGNYEIWSINPDGSALERVSYTAPHAASFPVWSPDGKRLLFTISAANPWILDAAKPWKGQLAKQVVVSAEFGGWLKVWSWSLDGLKLTGAILKADGMSVLGLGIYDLASGRLQRIPEYGYNPVWLADSHRLLLEDHRGRLFLVDSRSKHSKEILSIAPHILSGATISRDNREIYLSVVASEADIWLTTIN